jgi:prepilin-type N-terminal cleavage/methylation domain-containing protein
MKRARLSSQVKEAFRASSRGFTLVEVLITIALIGAIGVAFFSFMSAATSALIHADERTIAESLARSQLEFVKDQDYVEAPNGGEATYDEIAPIPYGYTIGSLNHDDEPVEDIVGVPWDSGNSTAVYQDKGLQRIKLVIKHSDKVVITMEGYKR